MQVRWRPRRSGAKTTAVSEKGKEVHSNRFIDLVGIAEDADNCTHESGVHPVNGLPCIPESSRVTSDKKMESNNLPQGFEVGNSRAVHGSDLVYEKGQDSGSDELMVSKMKSGPSHKLSQQQTSFVASNSQKQVSHQISSTSPTPSSNLIQSTADIIQPNQGKSSAQCKGFLGSMNMVTLCVEGSRTLGEQIAYGWRENTTCDEGDPRKGRDETEMDLGNEEVPIANVLKPMTGIVADMSKEMKTEARAQEIQAKNAALGRKIKEPVAPKGIKGRGDASFYRVTSKDNGRGMPHDDIPNMFGRVLSGTKYGLKQTCGKFGLGAKMVISWFYL
ncbi:hypothetical protein RJ641_007409 [Dillenia turbinata]|uniref:Uncharacterized protein n=1 Tax=Dillenia turbinata TaxID=194707 RepID=A0AAN8V156_9MAGN